MLFKLLVRSDFQMPHNSDRLPYCRSYPYACRRIGAEIETRLLVVVVVPVEDFTQFRIASLPLHSALVAPFCLRVLPDFLVLLSPKGIDRHHALLAVFCSKAATHIEPTIDCVPTLRALLPLLVFSIAQQ